MKDSTYVNELLKRVEVVKSSYKAVIDDMPDGPARSAKQKELLALHGTPKEFAEALVNAIGVISASEADFHMRVYRDAWEKSAS